MHGLVKAQPPPWCFITFVEPPNKLFTAISLGNVSINPEDYSFPCEYTIKADLYWSPLGVDNGDQLGDSNLNPQNLQKCPIFSSP